MRTPIWSPTLYSILLFLFNVATIPKVTTSFNYFLSNIKKRGILPATRPTHWGFDLAHLSETSNVKSPRLYANTKIRVIYIHEGITVALLLTSLFLKRSNFNESNTKRISNAFLFIPSSFTFRPIGAFGAERHDKYRKVILNWKRICEKKFEKKAPPPPY